ncbi:hypothetical protein IDH44_04830 [Paenibacillus sp. IB182496]|uniref:Uncharacterized protein n=1 Tax=Paenibacillus sabuli TaxID=2772509 RepID=A0A927BRD7_9BACL|nr:hypothetical protein [Paenibacillus sabuli]
MEHPDVAGLTFTGSNHVGRTDRTEAWSQVSSRLASKNGRGYCAVVISWSSSCINTRSIAL